MWNLKKKEQKEPIKLIEKRSDLWSLEVVSGQEKLEECGQKVQTSSYKISKSLGCHDDYSLPPIWCMGKLLRE